MEDKVRLVNLTLNLIPYRASYRRRPAILQFAGVQPVFHHRLRLIWIQKQIFVDKCSLEFKTQSTILNRTTSVLNGRTRVILQGVLFYDNFHWDTDQVLS